MAQRSQHGARNSSSARSECDGACDIETRRDTPGRYDRLELERCHERNRGRRGHAPVPEEIPERTSAFIASGGRP